MPGQHGYLELGGCRIPLHTRWRAYQAHLVTVVDKTGLEQQEVRIALSRV